MPETSIFAHQTQAQWLALAQAELKTKAEENLVDQPLACDLKAPVYISSELAYQQGLLLPELPMPQSAPVCFACLPAPDHKARQDTTLQTLHYLKTLEPQGIVVQGIRPLEQLKEIHQNLDLRQTALAIKLAPKDLPEYGRQLRRQFASVSAFQIQISSDPLALAATEASTLQSQDYAFIADFAVQFADSARIICPFLNTAIYHQAGASAIQQIAFSLAHIVESIEHLTQNGLSAASLWAKMSISLQVSHQYMAEIAKIRALRLLVLQMAGQAYKIQKPSIELFAQSSDVWFICENAENNLSRHTIGAMAAFLGGANMFVASPHTTNPKPAHLRNALNIGRLLTHEAHLDQARSAASGAYYLDYLTRTIAQDAWALFLEIQQQGGLSVALSNGFVGRQISRQQAWLLAELLGGRLSVAAQIPNKDKAQEKIRAINNGIFEVAIVPFCVSEYYL